MTVPRRHGSPSSEQPPRRDGLRALVDLASEGGVGPAERFVLPDGAREAAAIAAEIHRVAPAATDARMRRTAAVAVVAWALLSLPSVVLAGPAALALSTAVVMAGWATARVLILASTACGSTAGARARCVTLRRHDATRTARRAATAAAELLRAGDSDRDDAFDSYHQVLLSLTRYELAAEQAVAADRDRARLSPDDPLRSVAGQIAQDRAAHAVAHRAAARAAADRLEAALRSRSARDHAVRPAGAD